MDKNGKSPTKATRFKVTQRDIFTRDERIRFMASVENFQEMIMVRLGFNSGLRVSEILELQVKDVIVEDSVLHVRESKGGKSRFACSDRATVQFLVCYARENKLDPDDVFIKVSVRTLERWFKAILERTGITRIDATPHSMRHTNISMLLDKGMELHDVRDHAGHEDIATTMLYTHLTYHSRSRRYEEIMGE